MAVLKCKLCGGNLEVQEGSNICECQYCGSKQTVPNLDNEKKFALFNRANNLRFKSEFDKAAGIYESIIAEFPDEAEAYWGLVLCKYGIEYVDDKDGRKVPTCHRTLPTSIMKDEDFQQACENADISAKTLYREEAKAIDGIQKKILEIAATEEPYDIFICYKETDDTTGARTEDSSIAQDIYTALTEMGYKVFYARNSLRKVAGTEYEPYIYAALSSAKVMLAIGTKFDYYDAVWVKNEWSRFISMMADNTSKVLIPCYKNMDAYDIPEEFSNMQALDMADMMFFNSLEASVKRVLPLDSKVNKIEAPVINIGAGTDIAPLLKRAFMFLEDGDFARADEFYEQVLNIDPECAEAYLGKLMAELHIINKASLKNVEMPFDDRNNYQKVIRYGNEALKKELEECIEFIENRNENTRLENAYINAINTMNSAKTEKDYKKVAEKFESINLYKDAAILAEECLEKAKTLKSQQEEKILIAKKKKKKRNKIIALGFSTVAIILAVAILFVTVIIPKIKFSDIVAISAGIRHTVGLKSDGTIVAVGNSDDGCDVSGWTDIVAIFAGDYHTVGLKSDGTVVAVGSNYSGQCKVEDWTNIVAISAGNSHTVGLKSDGTVVATKYIGDYYYGQCDVDGWTDIVAISAGGYNTVGLKSDGTVVAVGENSDGQCDVSDWTDIVAISAGYDHMVGLKSDGTVVAVGSNYSGQCDVSEWKDIVVISARSGHTVGLKSDGTVVAVGGNRYGQCLVGGRK